MSQNKKMTTQEQNNALQIFVLAIKVAIMEKISPK